MSSQPVLANPPRARVQSWFGAAAAAVLLLASAAFVDLPLTVWLQAHATPAVTTVFEYIQKLGSSEIYLVPALLIYGYAVVGARRDWRCAWACGFEPLRRGSTHLIVAMVVGGLIVCLLKYGVARSRPEVFFEYGQYSVGNWLGGKGFNSFPSSHTMAAFSPAFVCALLWPRGRWLFLIVAAGVGCARLVTLHHYLSDVLASILFAYLAATWIAPAILTRFRRQPRFSSWL